LKLPRLFAAQDRQGRDLTETWVSTSCLNCATRCGTRVRVIDGRAVKVMGNPDSLVSEGEACPRSHIGLQVLYDEGRFPTPLKRTNPNKGRGVDPGWQPVSWEAALADVTASLKTLRDQGQPESLLLLRGLNSSSDDDLAGRFAEAYGTPNNLNLDGLNNASEITGRWLGDGVPMPVGYDLGRSNYVLAFGASILESHKPLARNLRMWGRIRGERPLQAKIIVIDPRHSVTAAKADRWLPINPGTDAALALAIANVIISEGLYDRDFVTRQTDNFKAFSQLVADYDPRRVAGFTGVKVDAIYDMAREFATTPSAVAWIGTGASRWPHGTFASYAIFCLNALVGSLDAPGGVVYQMEPPYRALPKLAQDGTATAGLAKPRLDIRGDEVLTTPLAATNRLADAITEAQPYAVGAMLAINANPAMDAPQTARWEAALAALPYLVYVGPFTNETSEYADVILPSATFMESWGYDQSPPGSGFAEARIKQPVVAPLDESRPVAEIIFELASQLGGSVGAAFKGIGDDGAGFARYRVESFVNWDDFKANGVWIGKDYVYGDYARAFQNASAKYQFPGAEFPAMLPPKMDVGYLGDTVAYPLTLASYQPLLTIEAGGQNYPWAQQKFMVVASRGWTNFAEISHDAAERFHVESGDMVWVESEYGRIQLQARVSAGLHPDVVAIARGQGHYANGHWVDGMGANPLEITGAAYDPLSGQSAYYNTRVKIYKA
jgi:anaerobic selenocysteine-containing dehydrogenase